MTVAPSPEEIVEKILKDEAFAAASPK